MQKVRNCIWIGIILKLYKPPPLALILVKRLRSRSRRFQTLHNARSVIIQASDIEILGKFARDECLRMALQ